MALDTSSDFGKPDPYSHAMLSRISNPASSMAAARRCQVREPPNASMFPPGLRTRRHSRAHASHHSWNSAPARYSGEVRDARPNTLSRPASVGLRERRKPSAPSHSRPMNSRPEGGSVTTAWTELAGDGKGG